MKPETMFYIALGTVIDLIEKADCWASFIETAEDTVQENRCRRYSLKYKTKAIVDFDRMMDRLVKEAK